MIEAQLRNRIKILEDRLVERDFKYRDVLNRVSVNGVNDVISLQLTLPFACRWALGEIERLTKASDYWYTEFEVLKREINRLKRQK